jgi:molybdopterin-containing oxidoreductase family membrane subunit
VPVPIPLLYRRGAPLGRFDAAFVGDVVDDIGGGTVVDPVGAQGGLAGGFALAIWTALSFKLIVGGKYPVSIIPYCIVAFEGTILIGALANLLGVLILARLGPLRTHPAFEKSFSVDKFGLFAECDAKTKESLEKIMNESGAENIKTVGL